MMSSLSLCGCGFRYKTRAHKSEAKLQEEAGKQKATPPEQPMMAAVDEEKQQLLNKVT